MLDNKPFRLLAMPGYESTSSAVAAGLAAQMLSLEYRRFPDGESYLRIHGECEGAQVLLVCGLENVDSKVMPLLLAARTLRDMGAQRLILVAPYLAYMRQDQVFQGGESLSAAYFGELISHYFDGLITVDPHLHRIARLEQVYSIPCVTLHAAGLIAQFLREQRQSMVLVGPDGESEQWVSAVARLAGLPFTILEKERLGDRKVKIRLRDHHLMGAGRLVFVDDMISTGHTLLTAAQVLDDTGCYLAPWAVCIHGLFSEGADKKLLDAGFGRLVSANTVAHASNEMDVTPLLIGAVQQLVGSLA